MELKEPKFYLCKHCNNILEVIDDSGLNVNCCEEKMELLVANTVDASKEKHVPHVKIENNNVYVKVGSVEHPMLSNHYIKWIYIHTTDGIQRKRLEPNTKPETHFVLNNDEKLIAAYEYCNLHGLWKKEI